MNEEKQREKKRIDNHAYRLANKGKAREYFKRYYQRNRESIMARLLKYRKDNAEKIRSIGRTYSKRNPLSRRSNRLKIYGLTVERFEEMLAEQGGLCAIAGCGRQATEVDHSHVTGQVRALLCLGCNSALGFVKDCPERLDGLVGYAARYGLVRYGNNDFPKNEERDDKQLELFVKEDTVCA